MRTLAWRPTLVLVPSLLPGLNTCFCQEGKKDMDIVVLLHALSPLLCLINTQQHPPLTQGTNGSSRVAQQLSGPFYLQPLQRRETALLTWVEGINQKFLPWDSTSRPQQEMFLNRRPFLLICHI